MTSGRARAPRPAITVVVPTYNRSRWVQEALDSVLAQSFTDFLVIVSDNASVDDTPEVIRRYTDADARVEYVRRDENIGWLRNFNAALAAVTTEYVTILNDDDLMRPGALERAVEALEAAPRAGLLHTALDIIGVDGELVVMGTNWTHGLTKDTDEPGQQFIRRSMRYLGRVCPPSAVVRTRALPAVPYDPADEPNSDHTLHLTIALDWDVIFLATPGMAWRGHEGQDSSDMIFIAPDGSQALQLAAIWRMRDVKRRFIGTHAARLRMPWFLRWQVVRFVNHELVLRARAQASRGRGAAFAEMARGVRRSPTIVLEPLLWKMVVRTMLGSALVGRLRRVTHHTFHGASPLRQRSSS
jgi:hypothetical protein